MSPVQQPPRWRDWPIRVLGAVLVLALIGVTWYWTNPSHKTATVHAMLAVTSAAPVDPADVQDVRRDEVYRQTQVGLLRTHTVLEAALRSVSDQNLSVVREQSQPAAWLERELRVEAPAKSKAIRVSLTGDRPEERAQLVNAVVRAYLAEFAETEKREQQDRLRRCERLVADHFEQLGRQMTDLDALGKNLETVQPSRPAFTSPLLRSPLQQDLEALVAQMARSRLELEGLRKKEAAGEPAVTDQAVEEALANDGQTIVLRAQVARLKRTVADYRDKGASASELVRASLKGYQADLAAAEKKLDHRREEIRTLLTRQQSSPKSVQQNIKQLEDQIARWTEDEKALRQRMEAQPGESDPTTRRSLLDVGLLVRELERKLDVARRLAQDCEAVRKEVQTAPRVQLVLEAAWPEP